VAGLNADSLARAREVVALYPHPRSALIPLCHIAQEQEGWLTPEAISQIAELVGVSAAEVQGTASFYDMLKLHPVGRYVIGVCTNISCMLGGAYELLAYAEDRLGIRCGQTSPDGLFTLEEMECMAACDGPPCVTVNYRYFPGLDPQGFDRLVDDLSSGRLSDEVPHHGTLSRVRRSVPLKVSPERVAAERAAADKAAEARRAASGEGGR
jgi:NADH-quinone oxidoreductase subunit E